MNLGPSMRDLISFISPNATKQDRLMLCRDADLLDNQIPLDVLKKWEDEEICALIIAVSSPEKIQQSAYSEVTKTLSCPLIRLGEITEASQILSAREMGFDALIVPVTQLTADVFSDFTIRAQAVHMRMIPSLVKLADLEKVRPLKPRFVYLSDVADAELVAALSSADMWIMAHQQMTGRLPVKCIVEAP